jgi:hypothetical protein
MAGDLAPILLDMGMRSEYHPPSFVAVGKHGLIVGIKGINPTLDSIMCNA